MILFEDDNTTGTEAADPDTFWRIWKESANLEEQLAPPSILVSPALHVSDPASLNSALDPAKRLEIRQRVEQLSGRPDTLHDSLQSADRVETHRIPGLLRKRDVVVVDLVGSTVIGLGLTADRKT